MDVCKKKVRENNLLKFGLRLSHVYHLFNLNLYNYLKNMEKLSRRSARRRQIYESNPGCGVSTCHQKDQHKTRRRSLRISGAERSGQDNHHLHNGLPDKDYTELISISNFHENHLRKKFWMNYIPEKAEIRDRSFSGIQDRKRSMLPAIFKSLRFFSSGSTRFFLIFSFDLLKSEGVIKQFRDMGKDGHHCFGTGSGPAAASGFHAARNGFSDIQLLTAETGQVHIG